PSPIDSESRHALSLGQRNERHLARVFAETLRLTATRWLGKAALQPGRFVKATHRERPESGAEPPKRPARSRGGQRRGVPLAFRGGSPGSSCRVRSPPTHVCRPSHASHQRG